MRDTVKLNGEKWEVRADYRKIRAVIRALTDPTLDMLPQARVMAALKIFYVDFEKLKNYQEAYQALCDFLDFGGKATGPRLIDLDKDWKCIVPAVNRAAGQPIRNMEFLHIEDFMGYLQERDPESTISHIINIRYALATGKFSKLSKGQKEFYYKNKEDIDLEPVKHEPVQQMSIEDREQVLMEFYAIGR